MTLRPYEDIYDHLSSLPPDDRVLLDSATANSHITQSLAPRQIIDAPSPATALKAVKSPGEQDGFRRAHLLDGVALTRFLYRLKTAPAGLTELSAAALLHDLRAESEEFLQDSFSTIVAYGPHGAVVHYEPTAETDVPLEARGLLLCDSGGHYRGGTTDVTRTVALGQPSDEMKKVYGIVLDAQKMAQDAVAAGKLCRDIDAIARNYIYSHGYEGRFGHGLGHSVGIDIHEDLRFNQVSTAVLKAGQVMTVEPGIYLPGVGGVRIENSVVVREGGCEVLTFPDRELIIL